MFRLGSKRGGLSLIGMDIGRRGIRWAQLARPGREAGSLLAGRWQLRRAFCWEWSSSPEQGAAGGDSGPGAAVPRSEKGRLELARRIKQFLRQNEFQGRDVVVGLSSPEVELHTLELPLGGNDGDERNMRQAAHWEIERLVSFTEGSTESDFWLLPPSGSANARGRGQGDSGQPTAIGVAAEKTVVSGVWDTCVAAGLTCRRLDAGLCALTRFGSWLRSLPAAEDRPGEGVRGPLPERPEGHSAQEVPDSFSRPSRELWGLLDLGDHQVRLVICLGDIPVLVRCFDTGGRRWVHRVSDALGLSFAAAEVHLRDHGIQASGRGSSGQATRGVRNQAPGEVGTTGGTTGEGFAVAGAPSAQLGGIIRNILREELSALCGEIEQSYRYALQCYPDHQVSELLLVGGGADLRNLDEYLKGQLGIEVCSAGKRLESTAMAAYCVAGKRYSTGALACAIGLAIPPGPSGEVSAVRQKSERMVAS